MGFENNRAVESRQQRGRDKNERVDVGVETNVEIDTELRGHLICIHIIIIFFLYKPINFLMSNAIY